MASPPVAAPTDVGATSADWFTAEGSFGGAMRATAGRLFRRAKSTRWLWFGGSLVLALGMTYSQSRKSLPEEVKVVLRAHEGVAASTTALSREELAGQIRVLAFTTNQLVPVMRKYPALFPDVDEDPGTSAQTLRDQLKIGIDENDFDDVRRAGDPPRSCVVALAFTAPTGKLAAGVANDLARLVATAGQNSQETLRQHRAQIIDAAVKSASAELDDLMRENVAQWDPRLEGARARLSGAQGLQARAASAAKAVQEGQALTFEILDEGRVAPPTGDRRVDLAITFLLLLALFTPVLGLLIGAFDPRVVSVEDLTSLGVPVIGHVPALPRVPST